MKRIYIIKKVAFDYLFHLCRLNSKLKSTNFLLVCRMYVVVRGLFWLYGGDHTASSERIIVFIIILEENFLENMQG